MDNKTGATICKRIITLSLLVAVGAFNKSSGSVEVNNQPIRHEQSVDGLQQAFLPSDERSGPRSVGYSIKPVEDGDVFTTQDGVDFQLDRVITFYTDQEDPNRLMNCCTDELKAGERTKILSQENGVTDVGIYKQMIMVKER